LANAGEEIRERVQRIDQAPPRRHGTSDPDAEQQKQEKDPDRQRPRRSPDDPFGNENGRQTADRGQEEDAAIERRRHEGYSPYRSRRR
jgi:hypothetical protein